jgi:hypothetical protein
MASVIRHNLTAGWFVVVFGIPLACLGGVPQLNLLVEQERMQTAAMAPSRQVQESIRQDVLANTTGSRIPLQLVEANRCVPVVLTVNGGPAEFLEDTTIVANTPNGQPVPPGTYVCSETGKSARVGVDSTLEEVQFTPLDGMDDYRAAYEKLREFQNRAPY